MKGKEKAKREHQNRRTGSDLDFVREAILSLLESPFSPHNLHLAQPPVMVSQLGSPSREERRLSPQSLVLPLREPISWSYLNSSKPHLVICLSPKRSLPGQSLELSQVQDTLDIIYFNLCLVQEYPIQQDLSKWFPRKKQSLWMAL